MRSMCAAAGSRAPWKRSLPCRSPFPASPSLDESAASLGAGPWRRFRDVIVPNARPGILAGALAVVTLSLGEFNLTWMLHTPLTKTLPVGLADSYASMRLEIASAYTLVFFLMIIPLLVAMQLLADRSGTRS